MHIRDTRRLGRPLCRPRAATLAALLALAVFSPSGAGVGAAFPEKGGRRSAVVVSTLLGGTAQDMGQGVAVDAHGAIYVVGATASADFPVRNALQTLYGGAGEDGNGDLFVAKFTDGGERLVYATYLGGSGDEYASAIAADAEGNAYVVGATRSSNFPTKDALQPQLRGRFDAFVAKLGPEGRLLYSTYFGGSGDDGFWGVAVDTQGNTYATGVTTSADFPTTPGAFQESGHSETGAAFVVKFAPDGASLVYASYLGGTTGRNDNASEGGTAVAVDAAGCAYVTGVTTSVDFPTVNALQPELADGGLDGFVSKFSADGSALVYSTYFGGTNGDTPNAIAVDASGSAHLAGATFSADLPLVRSPLPKPISDDEFRLDGFLAKLSPDGGSLLYSTYLGGNRQDQAFGVALDAAGNAYVAGKTASKDFPAIRALQRKRSGLQDAFVIGVSAEGAVLFSTYFGGKATEVGTGTAVDKRGGIYVTGASSSADFPLRKAVQAEQAGGLDAFLTRIKAGAPRG